MSIANSETSTSSRRRDTGFPEPFCGNRNTSLPHPDADTSPNACITSEDIAVSRALSRHRRSFLAKNRRTISHGYLTPEEAQVYNEIAVTSDSDASPTLSSSARLAPIPGTPALGRPASGGGDSFASASTGEHEDVAPKPPAATAEDHSYRRHSRMKLSADTTASSKSSRRRSFMGRLRFHKHHD